MEPFACLADAAPDFPASQPWQAACYLLMGLGGLALLADRFMALVINWRQIRQPSVDVDAEAKIKALEADLHEVEVRLERRISESMGNISSRLQSLENTLTHLVGDFNYALGKIDGRNATD